MRLTVGRVRRSQLMVWYVVVPSLGIKQLFTNVTQNYEKCLAQALYSYIRAGRSNDAVELYRKAHQSWRSASIHGSTILLEGDR